VSIGVQSADFHPTEADLAETRCLFEGGQYLQAFHAAKKLGDIVLWEGCPAQILAGRLADNLGAPGLGRRLLCRAYRSNRKDPIANYFRAASLCGRYGPLRAWIFLTELQDFSDSPNEVQADLLALRARVLGMFRDFHAAERHMERAVELAPARAWVWCEHAELQRARDDLPSALESARKALELKPLYRHAVIITADLLQSSNRDEEAVALLAEADEKKEYGQATCKLAFLQTELGHHEMALQSWLRAETLHPMAEPRFRSWLQGCLADAHYNVGRFELAGRYAEKAGTAFYAGFAGRLASKPQRVRVILPVPSVIQRHLTCAPATLSALSLYWAVPVDHVQLAAEICYEGTYDHVERHWAETEGFIVHEFNVTWEIACELIDRAMPFSIETVETTTGHLQAVIGYDLIRQTLILREPSQRVHSEVCQEEFLSRYLPFGPRGMLILPKEEAQRIEGISLPDSELYAAYYRLQRSLVAHDRIGAAKELDWLEGAYPDHRLTFWARRRLSSYDGNPIRELEAVEKLIGLFPDCASFLWSKGLILGRLASGQNGHREFLKKLATGHHKEFVFWRDWGRELAKDRRKTGEARRYLSLAVRARPSDAENLAGWATFLWEGRELERATELYRFAACLPGGGERHGRSYFIAARHVRKTDQAVEFLRSKFKDAGKASVQPTRALFFALSCLERRSEALRILEEALQLRPDDGDLLLFAADEFARHGDHKRADELLAAAKTLTSRASWSRTAAAIANYRCDHAGALQRWREILEAEPLASDAFREIALLLSKTEGPDSSLDFLRGQIGRFPHYSPLVELQVEMSRDLPAIQAETVIRRAIETDAPSAFMHRELALNLSRQGRHDEALTEAREAMQMDPSNPSSPGILGQVLSSAGKFLEAAEAFRAALSISVDYTWAIRGLFSSCITFEQKVSAVDFVRQQLSGQVVFGDGISAFREEAYAFLPPEELLSVLREAHAARRDLWQTWSSVASQLIDMKRLDEALEVMSGAVKHFPLLSGCWFELGTVRKFRGEWDEAIAAFSEAISLTPGWVAARCALSDCLDRKGDFSEARRVLEQAIAFTPLDAQVHGSLADVYWRCGDREMSISSLKHAIRLDPNYNWAWETLAKRSLESGPSNPGLELARELTRSRAGESRSWMRLVNSLAEPEIAEKLDALDRAEALDPFNADIHDARACTLAQSGRYEEALEACCPSVYGASIPLALQGRAAWIRADRGDLVTAVKEMREVVARSPSYYFGWSQLAHWSMRLGEFDGAMDAAENMVRLAPRSSVPIGYIAEIELKRGNVQASHEAFQKAFKLEPSNSYAGFQVFDRQMKVGHIREAEETLQTLKVYHPGPETEASQVRLDCRELRKKAALEGMKKICFAPARDTDALRAVAAAIDKAGWGRNAEKIFKGLLGNDTVNPDVGALWVESFTKRRFWFQHWKLLSIRADSRVGLAARHAYLKAAATSGKKRLVRRLIRRDGSALRSDASCWGQVGYALATLGLHSLLVDWMRDWKERPDIQPWMLFNLAISMRSLSDDSTACAVSLHALKLKGDHTTLRHQVFAAWDEAMAGNTSAARRRLAIIPVDELPVIFKIIRGFVVAIVSVFDAKETDKVQEYQAQKVILQQAGWRPHFADRMVRVMGKRTVKTLAASAGKRPFRLGGFLSGRIAGSYRPIRLWIPLAVILINILRGCHSHYGDRGTQPSTSIIEKSGRILELNSPLNPSR